MTGILLRWSEAVFPGNMCARPGRTWWKRKSSLRPAQALALTKSARLRRAGALEVEVFRQPLVLHNSSGSDLRRLEDCVEADLRSGRKLPNSIPVVFPELIGEAGGKPLVMPL